MVCRFECFLFFMNLTAGASLGFTQDGCEMRVTDTLKEYSSNFYYQILPFLEPSITIVIIRHNLMPFFEIYYLLYNPSVLRTGAAHTVRKRPKTFKNSSWLLLALVGSFSSSWLPFSSSWLPFSSRWLFYSSWLL